MELPGTLFFGQTHVLYSSILYNYISIIIYIHTYKFAILHCMHTYVYIYICVYVYVCGAGGKQDLTFFGGGWYS